MVSLQGFDVGFSGIPQAAFPGLSSMDGDEYVRCSKCGHGGCDVRVSPCGCTVHARCLRLNINGPLDGCPLCGKHTNGLVLFPMSFREIDEAHKAATAVPKGKSRKRKSPDAEEKGFYVSERRTGRWTNEEMALCDKLIAKFENGELPVADNVKLNEFLGAMLKSKQSRLTKKMKNAKLSSKSFQRTSGCLDDPEEARHFSELEEGFFQAVTDQQERAEIKFHMQKEWREQFSRVCGAIGQPLDADSWLSSVEEMDRRASQAKDAARMAKRKMMMGVALRTDARNPEAGVFIEKTESEARVASSPPGEDKDLEHEILTLLSDEKPNAHALELNGKSTLLHSAPFLSKVVAYVQRHHVPFEHIDLWVPSFVPSAQGEQDPTCRLCYAGSATVEKVVPDDVKKSRAVTTEESFNFLAFGDYSQKFSFDVGCGLPGRVYESGRPTWEQSVHNAPHNHFERCGGALQWGIKTVVGIPIASPNVGRIVVTLYSCFDRAKDEELVTRLSEEFTRLMPSPKWKLVVDIGDVEETTTMPIATCAAPAHEEAKHNEGMENEPLPATAGSESDSHIDASMTVGSVGNDVAAAAAAVAAAAAGPGSVAGSMHPRNDRDPRIDDVISLLAEFMPSDAQSNWGPYLPGFMSLRLLLLRQTRSHEEEEIVRTMLDSYSSYTSGGRQRADIAVMLARDFIFINQQQQQQPPFLSLDGGMMAASSQSNSNLSLFGLPSTNSSLQNSPALAPIPVPGSNDSMSVVSH
mmetsp:Transcript_10465/g.23399  ORF Transcript_10465/g.23399 Transcript_10465/m.23399 type:complete len:750 (+) Transcript_10465:101-2350(+)|eukprot:CAMPEP_0168748428 /NCGR_PEP_ID=MMETSP0724-20121128/16169_1 /TAXON_ID=265536 /ORGANISM="Amphiprora sp., Strain CCMP467" /LENGTH=749 /DNA_ID=CAMNT_0008796253 /DNA_START=92 /DNA_END=2341 /DNA_ORIENTATION=-